MLVSQCLSICHVSRFLVCYSSLCYNRGMEDTARPESSYWEGCAGIEHNPNKMSGAWVFAGTRVPVSALFENLSSGASTEDFLNWYEGVEEWQVRAVLEHEAASLGSLAAI